MTEQFIDKYEIVSTLGRGSMGVVYKGRDPEIGRIVAIKTMKNVVLGDDASGREAMERFRQESRSAGRLHHPNIVTIFEAGRTANGSPYIVMEYVEGTSLDTLLLQEGKLDPLLVLHCLAQVGSAIDYAHTQNVIHRDLKPSNIIIDANYKPYLLDFGVAKISDTNLTPAGTVVGTPSYMSPEQIRGLALDGRTDQFSLAVVTYELLTGVRPFPGNDFTTVVGNIMHRQPQALKQTGPHLPKELEPLLLRGLEKERAKRYTTILEMAQTLARPFGVSVDSKGLKGGYTRRQEAGWSVPMPNQQNAQNAASAKAPAAQPGWERGRSQKAAREVEGSERSEATTLAPASKSDSGKESPRAKQTVIIAGVVAVVSLLAIGGGLFAFQGGQSAKLAPAKPVIEVMKPKEKPISSAKQATSSSIAALSAEPPEGYSPEQLAQVDDLTLELFLGTALGKENSLRLGLIEAAKRKLEAEGYIPELLLSPAFSVRIEALKHVRERNLSQVPRIQKAVLQRLADEEYLVRGFAAKVLSDINSEEVKKAFEQQLERENNELVRKVLLQVVGRE